MSFSALWGMRINHVFPFLLPSSPAISLNQAFFSPRKQQALRIVTAIDKIGHSMSKKLTPLTK